MTTSPFTALETSGGLLTEEFFKRLAHLTDYRVGRRDQQIPFSSIQDYEVGTNKDLREVIAEDWNKLKTSWRQWRKEPLKLDMQTYWINPLFDRLGYGKTLQPADLTFDNTPSQITHRYHQLLIHVVPHTLSLDRSPEGHAHSPHSLVQSTLNSSEDHLWGIVTNGTSIRLLRDHHSLTRQSYVEWDLHTIFEQDLYLDFSLLWLTLHASRMSGPNFQSTRPEEWVIEKWFSFTREQGVRALDQLQAGVQEALATIGSSMLTHPENDALRHAFQRQELTADAFYRELLRLIYRLIFTFVAEARDVLLLPLVEERSPGAEKINMERLRARQTYERYYALTPLIERASSTRARPGRHYDLYERIKVVLRHLHDGLDALALPALGSMLWREDSCPHVMQAKCSNAALLSAIRAMSFTRDGDIVLPTNWREVGADELGPIYEGLLERHARVNLQVNHSLDYTSGAFELADAAGNERKLTGAYYTPESLVKVLLDEALDPVIQRCREKQEGDVGPDDPKPEVVEQRLLSLTICDPTCGSGHFLVAAAHRLAHAVAQVRSRQLEPSPADVRDALRDVVAHCIFGVDMNPMAVELCKISLWLESMVPGKPLSFLDAHIQSGNALLGAWPAQINQGIPADAFKPMEGDDKDVAKEIKSQHRKELKALESGQQSLSYYAAVTIKSFDAQLRKGYEAQTIEQVHEQELRYQAHLDSRDYQIPRKLADLWCASFFWPLDGSIPANEIPTAQRWEELRAIIAQRLEDQSLPTHYQRMIERAEAIARDAAFFHWHLAFPNIFTEPEQGEQTNPVTGLTGGFDVVLGNPPWENIELKEQEFFSERDNEIATASKAVDRKKLIKLLPSKGKQELYDAYIYAKRVFDASRYFASKSLRYPLCGVGRVNTYSIFAEHNKDITSKEGRCGFIVPSGIATDYYTQNFFKEINENKQLRTLYDFENKTKWFPAVDSRQKFTLIVLAGKNNRTNSQVKFVFFAKDTSDLFVEEKLIELTGDEIELFNPNTKTISIFRTSKDADITREIYSRIPILIREAKKNEPENPWSVFFRQGLFNMSSDSNLFKTREELEEMGATRPTPAQTTKSLKDGEDYLGQNIYIHEGKKYLPLYEAKMIHHFDHRFGDYTDLPEDSKSTQLPDVPLTSLQNPHYCTSPRYWVDEEEVKKNVPEGWKRDWFMGWRDICRSTDERTVITAIFPKTAVGNNLPVSFASSKYDWLLPSLASSYVLDFIARFKVGGTHLNFFITNQLAIIAPPVFEAECVWSKSENYARWIQHRVLELTYTNWELRGFGRDCGYDGPPFKWDEERRFLLRCELDAAFFHLYGIGRDDVSYIMDTFPIVKRKDEAQYDGQYRTRDTILAIYDAMAEATRTGVSYQTLLDPPPAHPSLAHQEP